MKKLYETAGYTDIPYTTSGGWRLLDRPAGSLMETERWSSVRVEMPGHDHPVLLDAASDQILAAAESLTDAQRIPALSLFLGLKAEFYPRADEVLIALHPRAVDVFDTYFVDEYNAGESARRAYRDLCELPAPSEWRAHLRERSEEFGVDVQAIEEVREALGRSYLLAERDASKRVYSDPAPGLDAAAAVHTTVVLGAMSGRELGAYISGAERLMLTRPWTSDDLAQAHWGHWQHALRFGDADSSRRLRIITRAVRGLYSPDQVPINDAIMTPEELAYALPILDASPKWADGTLMLQPEIDARRHYWGPPPTAESIKEAVGRLHDAVRAEAVELMGTSSQGTGAEGARSASATNLRKASGARAADSPTQGRRHLPPSLKRRGGDGGSPSPAQ